MNIYLFHQNNSGGYYISNDTIGENVAICANNENAAIDIADELGLFGLPFCKCCGRRFSEYCAEYSLDELETLDRFYADDIRFHFQGAVYNSLSSFREAL
jgi:hypothetical protein